ncbi:2,3-bisphosphoglycerate-dependent phosphoglycerate mutase [Candidatus Daviesbacteria bacterium]|nr:2,3-bisphosphoglycerate-dependent phosphoglycerate mutase [Candidatus Daviesbacteria bacterium]
MAYLALVRHGISEYNKSGLWTGWDDPDLAKEGLIDAKKAGETLKDIYFDLSITSDQKRSKQTLDEILKVINQGKISIIIAPEIKERSYGIFTKKNKWQVREEVGEKEFQKIRRSYNYEPKDGESLKQVNQRFVEFYKKQILPKLTLGKNILIVSSGNAFRAFLKTFENLSVEQVTNLEFGIGEVYLYQVDKYGKILKKQIRNKNPKAGKQ